MEIKQNEMYTGTVKWFRDNLGYGYIETSEIQSGGTNLSLFAHYSKIQSGEDFKTLTAGAIVSFEIAKTVKGLQAVNIREFKIIKTHSTIVTQ